MIGGCGLENARVPLLSLVTIKCFAHNSEMFRPFPVNPSDTHRPASAAAFGA
jgi:hypothetical protein